MTRGPAIQEPKFSVCGIVFDGGCDGRGCGCHIFLALHARPSHSQGTAARRRALLLGTTLARATQHGRVCFHRARRQAQVPCFLNSRGDLGSTNAALRLSVSVVAAALWWLKRQARKVVFVSAALPRCAALRPGRVRGPSRAPSGAAGLLGCARGTVSTLHMVIASCSPPFCALML